MTNIVVGSGIAGLTLALMLAKQGQEVLILEAKEQAAPLMNGFKRKGLYFDTGFHYAGGMHKNGILYKWLDVLDLWKHLEEKELIPLMEEFHFKNTIHSFPSNESLLEASIQEQFFNNTKKSTHKEEHKNLINDFNRFRSIMQDFISSSPFLNSSQTSLSEHKALHEQSLSSILEDFDFPELFKQMLTARCQLLGISPNKCSLKNYAVLSEPYFQSSMTIENGGKAIREAFLKELAAYDVEIQCNSIVEKIIIDDKKIKALQINKKGKREEIACKNCFFTGHPKKLSQIAPKNAFRPAFIHRIEDMQETPLAFMLFGETQSDYLKNKVVYILDENEENFFNPLEEKSPIIYISSGEAVNGRHPLVAIATIKNDIEKSDPSYARWKNEMSLKLKNYIEQRIPELSEIHILDASTPHSMRDWVYSSTGSLYGISHECNELPLLPITKVEGFYMAGQNILLPGLLGSMISAVVCLSLIYGYDEILQGFRTWKKDA